MYHQRNLRHGRGVYSTYWWAWSSTRNTTCVFLRIIEGNSALPTAVQNVRRQKNAFVAVEDNLDVPLRLGRGDASGRVNLISSQLDMLASSGPSLQHEWWHPTYV